MSQAYQSGPAYIQTYSGILKIVEGVLDTSLVLLASFLGGSYQSKLLTGFCIYGLLSVVIFLLLHIQGIVTNHDFPWFWVEFINCGIIVVCLAVSSTLTVLVLTKGYIVIGVIGYTTVMVYALDALDKFSMANTPRARYVWTTPNMPELT